MKKFQEWLAESSLRHQLKVPQNPKHHPEGPVDRHTMMVRAALNPAIELLRKKQEEDPNGALANIDLTFSPEEIKMLRFTALLHDIGKGEALDPETLSAHGHENPETFEKSMMLLGPKWHQIYDQTNPKDKEDLWWIIKYHMSLKDKEGFQNKALKKELLDDQGRYKADRKIKLLLVFLLMDRMGRGGEAGTPWKQAKQFSQSNANAAQDGFEGINITASTYRSDMEKKNARTNQPIGNDPKTAVDHLRQRGKTTDQIRMALLGMVKSGKFQLSIEEIDRLLESRIFRFKDSL